MGTVDCTKQNRVVDQGLDHEGPYQVEEVQYLNGNRSYNFKPNNNIPTHYTPALRNHENISYGGGNHQGQRPPQNYQQSYIPPGFQGQHQGIQRADNQGQKKSQSSEEQMLSYMAEIKRISNMHGHKFAELSFFQENTNVFQANTNSSLKNLETQVGKLALNLKNQSRDSFPSDTKKNPKDCMAITPRSGKEVKVRKEVEKNKNDPEA